MINATLILHELLCMALICSVFSRAAKTDATVRVDVRLAFVVLGLSSSLGAAAPLVWGVYPTPVSVLMLGAFSGVQFATGRHWKHGVPGCFYKPCSLPRRRASDREISPS